MHLNDYQALALRTKSAQPSIQQLVNCALGCAGESGEFADTVKKIAFHGHPLDEHARTHMLNELGDQLWYITVAADALNATLDDVAACNVAKLRKRYPEGFSAERSLNRDMTDSLTVDGENATGIA